MQAIVLAAVISYRPLFDGNIERNEKNCVGGNDLLLQTNSLLGVAIALLDGCNERKRVSKEARKKNIPRKNRAKRLNVLPLAS